MYNNLNGQLCKKETAIEQEQNIFREKAVNRISSADQIPDYLHAANVKGWVILGAGRIRRVRSHRGGYEPAWQHEGHTCKRGHHGDL